MDPLTHAAQLSDALLSYIAEHSGVSKAQAHTVLMLEQAFWSKHLPELSDLLSEDEGP